MTAKTPKIQDTEDAWDTGALGQDEAFVELAADQDAQKALINEALELQPISIRLQKSLIEDFKIIASMNGGIGYQTLMRQVLKRFADCEIKRILREVASEQLEEKEPPGEHHSHANRPRKAA
jgi:predicted DNA binding CopG/RHH family protein